MKDRNSIVAREMLRIAKALVADGEDDGDEQDMKAGEIAAAFRTDYAALKKWISRNKAIQVRKALGVGQSATVLELMNAIVDAMREFK